MPAKLKQRSTLGYTIYSAVGTLLELGIMLAAVIWGLPAVGIDIPVGGLIILILLMLGFSYYTYHMGKKALTRKLILELEAMIGSHGRVMKAVDPVGFVRIGNELWQAVSSSRLEAGEEVVVTGVEGLKITVAPRA